MFFCFLFFTQFFCCGRREGLASKDATHLDRPLGDQTVRHIVNAYQRSHPEIRGKPQFEF